MKKLILCLTLLVSVLFAGFANSYDDLDVPEYQKENQKETMFSYNPGLRFSILGLEPTFSFNFYNLETEVACAFTSGFDGKSFGFAPSFSIGYCTNPFERGGVTTFGAEYLLVTQAYIKAFKSEMDAPVVHAVSLFYKGGYKFTDAFGVNWRVRLPLFMGGSSGDYSEFYNITSTQGGLICVLAGALTIGAGVQFSFH